MEVELREITSETVRAICELEVAAEQRSFVAPNAVSIAEAHFTPGHWMRAIYADGQPVGFVLTFDEPSEGYFLWRFMIAEGHQRRGIGRRAIEEQVLEHWRELGVTAARTSVVPSNTGATRLYESLGFRLTGEEEDGELVMSLGHVDHAIFMYWNDVTARAAALHRLRYAGLGRVDRIWTAI